MTWSGLWKLSCTASSKMRADRQHAGRGGVARGAVDDEHSVTLRFCAVFIIN